MNQDPKGCFTPDLRNSTPAGIPERILPEDLSLAPDHLARYAFAAHWVPAQRVADVCCGIGYGSNLLAAAGASKIYGFDLSEAAVEAANKRYACPEVEFHCVDAAGTIVFPQVDLAICFEGIEHVTDPRALLQNMQSALTDSGIAIISTPNGEFYPGGHSGNPFHLREYTLREFSDLLGERFRDVKMYFQWFYNDPYDFQWNPVSALRALVPVSLKHAIRSRFRRSAPPAAAQRGTLPAGSAARYRPLPLTYLSLPGLRFSQPAVWVAVCKGPMRDPEKDS